MRFLLDANLSPETAAFLRQQFSFDVVSLIEEGKAGLLDSEVIALAAQEERIIITLDLDFGELYHQQGADPGFGAIVVRLRDQRIERVNHALRQFFESNFGKELFHNRPHALAVLNETSARVL